MYPEANNDNKESLTPCDSFFYLTSCQELRSVEQAGRKKEVHMQTLTIGELKTGFSEVLKKIRNGEEIVISYGKKREKVAVLVPYSAYASAPERTLGLQEPGRLHNS